MIGEKKLTIIVPSYNTGKFISDYPTYYVNSNYKGNYEVLLINDGSSDEETKEKIDLLVKQFPDYFNCIHKENGGHGSVINVGIQNAKGRYFCVIDGDDYINPKGLENLLDFLESANEDLILMDYDRHFLDKNTFQKVPACRGEAFYKRKIEDTPDFLFSIHTGIIRTDIWKENCIRVRENCFYEDNELVAYSFPYINSIAYLNTSFIIYNIGISGQSSSIKSIRKHRQDFFLVANDLMLFINNLNNNHKSYYRLVKKTAMFIASIFDVLMLIEENKNIKKMQSELKKFDEQLKTIPLLYKLVGKRKVVKVMRLFKFNRVVLRYIQYKVEQKYQSGKTI